MLVLVIRSPWGQNIIVDYATSFISDKTHTKVNIEHLFLTFSGDLKLEGVFLEDSKGDTLIYSKSLQADAPLLPIIRGKGIGVESLEWEGLRANIIRKDSIAGYNFQFLIDAFASNTPEPPQTEQTSEPLNIIIGNIHLNDFNIIFNDAVLGIDSHFKIGDLNLNMEKVDLEAMDFRASEIALKNTTINYIQNPVPPSPDTTATTLPYLVFDAISLRDVTAHYEATQDNISLDANINEFYTEIPEIDLPNNRFIIDEVALKESTVTLNTKSTATTSNNESDNATAPFTWPDMVVQVKNIDFRNNALGFFVDGAKPTPGAFNTNALHITNIKLEAEKVYLKDQTAGINLHELQFNEGSGLALNKTRLNLNITDKALSLDELLIDLNNSSLSGTSLLEYPTISALANAPEQSKMRLDLTKLQLDIKDAYRFQPDLKTNPYLDSLSQRVITGQLHAQGYVSDIQLKNTTINWGKTTQITASGNIKNSTNTDSLALDIHPFKAETLKKDVLKFVNEQDLGVNLPDSISLTGEIKGTLTDVNTNAILKTSQGNAKVRGHYNSVAGMAFDAELNIDNFKLNELLQNEALGPLSLTLKAYGNGTSINNLDAIVDANISNFKLKNYEIKNLPLHGEINKGKGNITSHYKDNNVNIDLKSHVVLDSIAPEAIVDLNIIGIDMQALGIMQRDLRAGLKLHADFKGNGENFDLKSNIDDGVIVFNDKTFLLGDIMANAHVRTDTTYIHVNNKLLNLELESNANPQTFSKALQDHVKRYFYSDSAYTDSINPVKLKLTGKLSQGSVLNDVLLVNLKDIDTIDIAVDFDQKQKTLNASIQAPHINYSDNEIDSLAFTMNTDPDTFNFDFGFKEIHAGPILIKQTSIVGNQQNKEMDLNFSAFDEDELLMHLNANISGHRDSLKLKVIPDSLIINRQSWQIPDSNQMVYTPKALGFTDFTFSKNNQSVAITNKKASQNTKDEISITYSAFNLKELLAYLNPDKELAQGQLNGQFTIQSPFEDQGYIADVSIEELNILKANFGTLSLKGNSGSNNTYDFNLNTKGGDVDLDIKGDYIASKTNPNLNVDFNINEFKMQAAEGLSLAELSDASGHISGQFKITGSTSEPQYKGDLKFNNANFTVTKLNTNFILEQETLNIDNSGISMSNFTIQDNNKSAFVLNGSVGTEDFTNPSFELDIKADDFQVLNATKDDNDMLYGQLSFDASGTITGDLNVPVINLNTAVNPDTNVTYVMPSAAVNIEERDGVVIFVNRQNPDAILTRTQEKKATVTGIDLNTNISITKEAVITIVLDESTGDNFQTSGDGDFVFSMDTTGRMNLSGEYTVSGGHYEMSLYELVRRKFQLVPGSRVSWSGNPLDANLDVKALYEIETSSSPLMASQVSGSDPAVRNKYKQVLPFEVYLNIDGELMHPKISFKLDMPEDEQGAIGGQVYGRVQQVNQQEGELNRQVFSLLVMNRFYPESGSDGSGGGFASIARDNLNDALSDQLNMFSDKLLGSTGVELDFGLNSFTDYQGSSPEQRTQLDVAAQKKLFNDRVIVRVGSAVDIEGSDPTGQEAPLIGDVSLEYLITPSGKYRLKAFQKNEYESVIDGQTIVSGLALIFTQEFNEFQELWAAMFRSDQERELAKKHKEEKQAAKED